MTKPLAGNPPFLIQFKQIGDTASGYLTTTQRASEIPFPVRRVFWTRNIPVGKLRGGHANKTTREVMVVMNGKVEVQTETVAGEQKSFVLDRSDVGLFIPEYCWLTIRFEPETILLCLASTDFDETDYIRDLAEFRNLKLV